VEREWFVVRTAVVLEPWAIVFVKHTG
jgi:hypothetical protein